MLAVITALLSTRLPPEPETGAPAIGVNPWIVAGFVAVMIPVAVAVATIAGIYPPNTPDAFTYHLPRAMYYLGQNSLAHFEAADLRQTHLPFNYDLLQLFGLRNGGVDDATSLEGLARAVGLSPSRLMHVFTSSVGIPLRPYLAWLRVQRAAIEIVSGNSLTDAALASGFADAAHMSRTFRRMLGIPPSLLRAMSCSV